MVVWSALRTNVLKALTRESKNSALVVQKRFSGDHGHRTMFITPSRWQWHKCKDMLHFYTLLGLIPVGMIIFYANVFIGPATLSETPEDYVPKHWEYYKSPITRWLARYIFASPQQEYEKYLHLLYEEDEKMKIRNLEKKVLAKMAERADYQAYYYKPVSGKYARITKRDAEVMAEIVGIDK